MKLLSRTPEDERGHERVFDTETGIVYERNDKLSHGNPPYVVVFHIANTDGSYMIEYRGKAAQHFWDVIAADATDLEVGGEDA